MKNILVEIKEILLRQTAFNKNILTSKEAAFYLGVSLPTIYYLTSTCKISHYKPSGKLIYFKKSDLDNFLKQNKVEGITG
jgi:excisionase family DNA binding protein